MPTRGGRARWPAAGSRNRSARWASASRSARRARRQREVADRHRRRPVGRHVSSDQVAHTTPSLSAVPWTGPSRRQRRGVVAGEAAAVGVGEQHVVVLRQEAGPAPGVSASGSGPSGTSSSSRPRSSRNVRSRGRSRSTTSRKPVSRDHGGHVGRGRRAEGGEVAQHDVVDRRVGDERPAEPRLGRRRRDLRRRVPTRPRGGTWTRASRLRQANARAPGSCVGEALGEQPPQLAARRGAARRAAGGRPRARRRGRRRRAPGRTSRWRAISPSSTGWTSGRSSSASSAVTRWIVPRITTMRTSRRSDEQRRQLVGVEAGEPRPQPEVRVQRHLGLQPDEVVDDVERRRGRRARAAAGGPASPGSGRGGRGHRRSRGHPDRPPWSGRERWSEADRHRLVGVRLHHPARGGARRRSCPRRATSLMPPTSTLGPARRHRRQAERWRPAPRGVTTRPGFWASTVSIGPLLVAQRDLGGAGVGERRGIRRVDHGDDGTNAVPFAPRRVRRIE